MNQTIPFSKFWSGRNDEGNLLIDELLTNRISIVFAYVAYRLGITPNQITLASCGLAVLSGILAFFLSTGSMILSVIIIFLLSQISYLLDGADGQLARCTNTTSAFGDFLDHGLDVLSSILVFGGFFAYVYRYNVNIGDQQSAELALLIGFFFILARTTRYLAWQKFNSLFEIERRSESKHDEPMITIAKSLMDHEFSMFAILSVLLSQSLCFAIFCLQGVILILAYFRYFYRAYGFLHH